MQLRLGASQTVSRPEFRELAPFEYTDVQGGFAARGNPNLDRAKILNADIALEWYLSPSEIFSVGFFYKLFDQPIEVVNIPSGSSLITTWENADSAELLGFEIEGKKSLDFFSGSDDPNVEDFWRNLSLLANFAYMTSSIEPGDTDLANLQTNTDRPLQGMPEYTLNLGLLYESKEHGFTVALLANTFGERISAVGASGIDDEKEQPRWSLDLGITKRLGKGTLKITAENILDSKYEYVQSGITTREYRKGWTIGVGYSYSF
jgi:outer membrane receptor protein involved in Fe transport